jgi:uncharacterized protein (TIGR03546 family)
MTLIVLIRKLLKALNSDGTPGQVAAGIALGAVLGLSPLFSLHNLLIVALAFLLQVSLPGLFLGWALFVPLGFLLDPLFDTVGGWLLLDQSGLVPVWTAWYNAPVIALTNFNNTIVLGSFLVWLVLFVPLFLLARVGVVRYRARVYPRLARLKVFQAVKGSKAYDLYRLFRPE